MDFLADLLKTSVTFNDEESVKFSALQEQYKDAFESISSGVYRRLNAVQQRRFIMWFLKRWGKIDIVDPAERDAYYDVVKQSFAVHGQEDINGVRYSVRHYKEAGYNFSLLGYDWFTGVHDIHFDQYATENFDVKAGDVIIDGGAFIGDTAVLFNEKAGGNCEVHAFELLDENLLLMEHNVRSNGIADKVFINKLALADTSGVEISIALTKLQASMSLMYPGEVKVNTITLDDYVKERGLDRIDFIKFDIEGAEIPALEGARETIERFRPRMALCLYHKWDDVVTIPAFLDSLSFEYEYEFKWVQLKLGTEGVILLTPKSAPEQKSRIV
ncbi:FkbM family methyltransferase [Pseudomonas borbori]